MGLLVHPTYTHPTMRLFFKHAVSVAGLRFGPGVEDVTDAELAARLILEGWAYPANRENGERAVMPPAETR